MSKISLSLSPFSEIIKVGTIYEHYKGNRYKIIALAFHSETLEEMVVYEALHENGGTWVRPLKMFIETVNIDGEEIPRFKALSH